MAAQLERPFLFLKVTGEVGEDGCLFAMPRDGT